jgi:hypothetical protein
MDAGSVVSAATSIWNAGVTDVRSDTMLLSSKKLTAKTDQELVELYTAAAATHGIASFDSNYKQANAASAVMEKVYVELKNRKKAPLLSQLLSNSDPSVVTWAATHLLPFNAEGAEAALERISELHSGMIAFSARMVLKQWRAGELY